MLPAVTQSRSGSRVFGFLFWTDNTGFSRRLLGTTAHRAAAKPRAFGAWCCAACDFRMTREQAADQHVAYSKATAAVSHGTRHRLNAHLVQRVFPGVSVFV